MVDPFASLSVSINDRPIYCMQFKGALSPGNWVLFENDDSTFESDEEESKEETSLGLIMATSEDGKTLEVNLFRRVT